PWLPRWPGTLQPFQGISSGTANALSDERARWPLWIPVGIGAGVGLYFALPSEPSPPLIISVCGAAICSLLLVRWSPGIYLRLTFAVVLTVAVGFFVAKIRTNIVAAPILSHRIGPVHIEGRVVDAQLHGEGIRALIAPDRVGALARAEKPKLVR